MDGFTKEFINDTIKLGLNYKNTDSVFQLCEILTKNINKLTTRINKGMKNETLDFVTSYIAEKIHKVNVTNTLRKMETISNQKRKPLVHIGR